MTTLRTRMTVLAALVAFMFVTLTVRLWFLQVLASDDFSLAAEDNQVRVVHIPAPRGEILDRHGRVLVDNRQSLIVTVDRSKVSNPEELLYRLGRLLRVRISDLAERFEDPSYLPYEPVPMADDVPEKVVAYIKEHQERFPGVSYRQTGIREHPYGALAAHVLGYLGEISAAELHTPGYKEVRPGQLVGRGGVEQHYEPDLRGTEGIETLQVNAQGKILDVLGERDPVPGHNLVLSVDARIQRLAESTLRDGIEAARGVYDEDTKKLLQAPAGAIIVMDPNNGQVIALASYPAFDPRIFENGLTEKEWKRLKNPKRHFPINDRALQGLYPPASAFKPFVATAAIKAGYAKVDGYYDCPAKFKVPGDKSGTVFHNWEPVDRGPISLGQALAISCDTVFYRFGLEFYRERKLRGEFFQQMMRRWGFDRPTGVDLPVEAEGRIPDTEWKQTIHDLEPRLFPEGLWLPGDNINIAVGQGDVLVTPFQMAVAYSALANGGTVYRPHLGMEIRRADGSLVHRIEPEAVGRVPVKKRILQTIGQYLVGVTGGEGTAAAAFSGLGIQSAGKTGTGQVVGKQPTSWYAGFAPIDDPRYVVVAVVEEGGHGAEVAAPLVRRMMEGLFDVGITPFRVGVAAD